MSYDKNFISKAEGGRFLQPYAIDDDRLTNSGVTIATGVDLSKQDPEELKSILSEDQINYLRKRNAFSAVGTDAVSAAQSLKGFEISDLQAEALENRVYNGIESKLRQRLNEASGKENRFDEMTPRQKTALMSLAVNHGPELRYENGEDYRVLKLAAAGDWSGYVGELNNFGEKTEGLTKRRLQEAQYLGEEQSNITEAKIKEQKGDPRKFTSKGKEYYWIDGDTFVDDSGTKYRVKGYDARETYRIRPDEDRGVDIKYGENLAEKQTELIANFQQQNEFFDIVPSTGFGGRAKTDDYGRVEVSLRNKDGEDFTSGLYSQGYAEINDFTSEENFYKRQAAQQFAELDDQPLAGDTFFNQEDRRFKQVALNEAEYGAAGDLANDIYSGVQFRNKDRDLENNAYNRHVFDQAPEAFAAGWEGVKQSFLGFADMVGVGTGLESVSRFAKPRIEAMEYQLSRSPKLLMDYKDVDSVWDGFTYVINNTATSAPYMGALIGASVLNPALGMTSTGMMHSGNVWNEIEGDKGNAQIVASLAAGTAMATLDRLGLRAIFKPTDMLSSSGRLKVANYLATQEAAGDLVTSAMRKKALEKVRNASASSVIPLLKDIAKANPEDIAKLSLAKVTGKGALAGFAAESLTESGQEGIQYVTSALAGTGEIDNDELENRLINAFVAGGSIGGGLGAAGGVRQYGSSKVIAADLKTAEKKRLNEIQQMRMEALEDGEIIETVEDITADLSRPVKDAEGRANQQEVSERAERHKQTQRGFSNTLKGIQSFPDVFDVLFSGVSKAFKSAESAAFSIGTLRQSKAARKLLGLIGSTAQSVYHTGKNFEAHENILVGKIRGQVDTDRAVRKITGGAVNPTNTRKASEIIYEYVQTGKFPDDIVNDEGRKRAVEVAAAQLQMAYQRAYNSYAREYAIANNGQQLPPLNPNYFVQQATFDPQKVAANPDGFKQFVKQENKGISDSEVNALYNAVISGRVNSFDSEFVKTDFSFLNGKEYLPKFARTGTEYLRGDSSGFNEFAQDNIFNNFDSFANQVAKATTNAKYFGVGGSKIATLLQEMKAEGVSEEELDRVSFFVKSIVDAKNGHFNRIENQKLEAVQRYLTTYAIYIGLPLAAIASLPETVMVFMGLKNNRDFANAMGNLMREALETLHPLTDTATTKGEIAATKVGLGRQQTDIAARVATGERNMAHNWYTEKFFSITGLKGVTQFQRRTNAAFAIDYVANGLDTLEDAPQIQSETGEVIFDTKKFTNAQQEAYVKLVNLGLNVEELIRISKQNSLDTSQRKKLIDIGGSQNVVDILDQGDTSVRNITPEGFQNWEAGKAAELEKEFVNEQMETAVYKFVNERIQNPQASNRPLLFQDPHYQMLTQFNGFISTFTSVVLPKLYRDYIVKGAPRVKYETAGFVLLMMAMGGASQYLKDLLKYGQPSPYIDDFEYIQRAIYSSGVIGSYERLVEMTPAALYQERSDGTLDYLFNTLMGETGPTARNIGTAGKLLGSVAEGDAAKATENALKLTPMGTFTGLRKELGKAAAGEQNEITDFLY